MSARMKLIVLVLLLAGGAAPAFAQNLQMRIERQLAAASPGARFGMVVADESGTEVVAINPEGRFIPASNTKIFTTAAAYMTMPEIDKRDAEGGATVAMDGKDVILTGYGDARLSSAPDCTVDCLAMLADAVAAKTRRVRNVVGDASLWPDQRWSPGMSWNNVAERSGTGIAALSLDSNEVPLIVMADVIGRPPATIFASEYFTIDNRAKTIAHGPTTIDVKRLPFERRVVVFGEIAVGAVPEKIALGIDDPAHYAAWRLATLLRERGVRVKGDIRSRYKDDQPLLPLATTAKSCPKKGCPRPDPPVVLARLTPPPLAEDIRTINKISQNLHADLLARRLGGLAVIETMLRKAGVARQAYDFADGSGMSTYNRVAPRGMVTLLRWIAVQPWGAAWRASLPIGGVDGTIARRFKGTILEGRIFAKTGTLNASTALSGYLTAKSGRMLTFSSFANDIPDGDSVSRAIDAALIAVASEN
jgi:serine-type D-Ala-D-Ala carboxypeptidase/endopeptidase (penicillin-binding protein 4)